MRALIFIIILASNFGFSQKSQNPKTNLTLTAGISKQRMDAFFDFGIKTRKNYLDIGAEIGFGIEKTFFQQTISPHLELFTFYNIIQKALNRKNVIQFGPGIILSGTTYKIPISINYGDVFIAYQISFGRKWKFFHHGGYGIMYESFNSSNGKIVSKAYNYCFKIGISHALNV